MGCWLLFVKQECTAHMFFGKSFDIYCFLTGIYELLLIIIASTCFDSDILIFEYSLVCEVFSLNTRNIILKVGVTFMQLHCTP